MHSVSHFLANYDFFDEKAPAIPVHHQVKGFGLAALARDRKQQDF